MRHFLVHCVAAAVLAAVLLAASYASQQSAPSKPAALTPPAGASALASPAGAQSPAASPSGAAPQAAASPALPLPVTTVVLDPAHGGPDSGAHGANGVAESEVVLDFARAVRVSLEAQGFRVLMTREGDQNPSFDDRSSVINGLRGAVFISFHLASTGPLGTARAYSYVFFPSGSAPPIPPSADGSAPAPPAPRPTPARPGLVEWDRAQASYTDASRRLAELVQIQLAQKLRGSPDTPTEAPVRQLRTIAAPAIAVEVSSVALDAKRLTQLNQLLADAVARAVVDFRAASAPAGTPPTASAAPTGSGGL